MICTSLIVNLYTYPNGILGVQECFLNGELHNPFGPAVQFFDPEGYLFKEMFFLNGKRHNTNGPAIHELDKGVSIYKEFWIDNNCMTEERFKELTNK